MWPYYGGYYPYNNWYGYGYNYPYHNTWGWNNWNLGWNNWGWNQPFNYAYTPRAAIATPLAGSLIFQPNL